MQNEEKSGRVSDAPSDNWVYNLLPKSLWPYAQLARWDRPIGWQLLMWPCFWSTGLAAHVSIAAGTFSPIRLFWHLVLFAIGAIAMRGAGCTYNDIVDHEIDMKVARTRSRPLPSDRVTRQQAKIFLALQAFAGLIVLLQFNLFSIVLGIASLGVVAIYPFAKRFTDWPQFVLGVAFSWGGLMGWAAEFANLSLAAVLLFCASIAWTIGYDTVYAHQDREDDTLIGVRSTALLFGDNTRTWLAGLYGAMIVLLMLAFGLAGVGLIGWLGLMVAAILLAWQWMVVDIDDPAACLALFKSNSRVGAVVSLFLLVALTLA